MKKYINMPNIKPNSEVKKLSSNAVREFYNEGILKKMEIYT